MTRRSDATELMREISKEMSGGRVLLQHRLGGRYYVLVYRSDQAVREMAIDELIRSGVAKPRMNQIATAIEMLQQKVFANGYGVTVEEALAAALQDTQARMPKIPKD